MFFRRLHEQLPQKQLEQGAAGGDCGWAAEESESAAAATPPTPGETSGTGEHGQPAETEQPAEWGATSAAWEGEELEEFTWD